jgi:hypothetical protein
MERYREAKIGSPFRPSFLLCLDPLAKVGTAVSAISAIKLNPDGVITRTVLWSEGSAFQFNAQRLSG